MVRLIVLDYILENKHDPFGDVHFEKFVLSNQLSYNFINGVVKFDELISFIMLIRENLLFYVHFHIE